MNRLAFLPLAAFAVILAIASPSFAQSSTFAADHENDVILMIGDAHFLIHPGADGQPEICRIKNVVKIDGPNPGPAPATTVRGKVARWTIEAGDPVTAQALAKAGYRKIESLLREGEITWEQALPILRQVTDVAVAASDDPESWKSWRTNVTELLTDLEQEGKVGTKEQQCQFLIDVADGLIDGSSQNLQAVDPDKLMALILAIIELIVKLIGPT